MVKMLNCEVVVSEFELLSLYYVLAQSTGVVEDTP